MRVIKSLSEMTSYSKAALKKGLTIGFVPTMGYLHAGHVSLAEKARKECDLVVVSIFVNPTQFGPKEDFAAYPRDIKRDLSLLKPVKVDIVFNPSAKDVYPEGYHTYVDIEGELTKKLCGFFRPIHFKGVTTIVAKLFNMVLPHRAYFGQKDAQQCVVIKKMVKDLDFPVEVIALPTIRENDGLAMSSRNTYLSPEERKQATILYRTLQKVAIMVKEGERSTLKLEKAMRGELRTVKSLKIQYASVVNGETLESTAKIDGETLFAIAVKLGKTRLIDNIVLKI